jgi:hypothetical protein
VSRGKALFLHHPQQLRIRCSEVRAGTRALITFGRGNSFPILVRTMGPLAQCFGSFKGWRGTTVASGLGFGLRYRILEGARRHGTLTA